MAYSATSEYGYITGDDLELAMTKTLTAGTYSYSEEQVCGQITLAERLINGVIGTSYSGTIPNNIISAATVISQMFMENTLIDDGKLQKDKHDIKVMPDLVRSLLDEDQHLTPSFYQVSL